MSIFFCGNYWRVIGILLQFEPERKETRVRERIFAGTRGQIIELLWRGLQTVDELAAALGLTDNAVRTHLVSLERDGLVRQEGRRRGRRKPSLVYVCTPAAEQLLPKPYPDVLAIVLDEFEARHGEDEVHDVLQRTGERLAAAYQARFRGLDNQERLREVGRLLQELGGIAEIEEREDGCRIRGFNCPLASLVAARPQACVISHALIRALLGEATVRERCEHNGVARCAFEVELPAGQVYP